jgi:hypothetical protein
MNPESLRQMTANCRRQHGRFLGFPRDWAPSRVRNPHLEGYFFTEAGAWDFIADKLEAGHPYEELVLDNPRGALAIVLKICLKIEEPLLYVKIQLGAGNKAIGRSFHYSDSYK